MKLLPNIITLLRIAGSLGLLLCDVMGVAYWIIYGLCGISDIADGWLARKLKCVTKTGALLDSVADSKKSPSFLGGVVVYYMRSGTSMPRSPMPFLMILATFFASIRRTAFFCISGSLRIEKSW